MRYTWLLFAIFITISTSCADVEDWEERKIICPPRIEESETIDSEAEYDTIVCSFEKYMELQPAVPNAQGSACHGNYFVQGYNYNSCVTIYNLKEKSCLGTIDIPAPAPSAKTHSNTLNFGNQRYDSNDYFPLLYVSSGYPTNGVSHIYVYRLTKKILNETEMFSISLVQTISLYDFGSWTEGIVDMASNNLWIKYQPDNSYGYACYKLPSVFDGDIDIYYKDYIKGFRLDRTPIGSRNQGHLYRNGKILLVTGVPSTKEIISFISIDTEKENRDLIIDLAEVGLVNPSNPCDNTFEPEGVIIYNGQLMICYRTAIYSFTIEKKKKDGNMSKEDNIINSNDDQYKMEYDILGKPKSGVKGIRIVPNRNTYHKVIMQ